LLTRFVGPAAAGALPAPLRRMLDASADSASSAVFSFNNGNAELSVRPFEHTSTGPGLLLVERAAAAGLGAPLSAREHEVLEWMTQGKTNAEIATILGISLHTVKRHVEKILQKLNVPNRSAAALSQAVIGRATYPDRRSDPLAC
jgi:DNA-binding CsgD family transcriptional regulator